MVIIVFFFIFTPFSYCCRFKFQSLGKFVYPTLLQFTQLKVISTWVQM